MFADVDANHAVEVGAPEADTTAFVALEGGGMGEAEEILSSDACEGMARLEVVEQAGGGRGAAGVVRDLEQIGAQVGITFGEDLFGAFFDVACEQESGLAVSEKHHKRVVVGVKGPVISRTFVRAGERVKDIDTNVSDHAGGGARKAAHGDALFVQDLAQVAVVRVSTALLVVPEFTDRDVLKERQKAAEVIGMRMRHYDIIEAVDALVP